MTKLVLVTGGAGFIGSHAIVALQQAGYGTVVLDNLCNSAPSVIGRIQQITGIAPAFVQGDVRDARTLDTVFAQFPIHAVMHFAGLKAVGESTQLPLAYYDNNINGSTQLLSAMQRAGVRTFIFSSSATVYGDPVELPLTESHARSATNPYGYTKLVIEDMLHDLYRSEPGWRIARLRYFNPVGAHPSGLIGEAPQGVPNNLMPYVAQVATGKRDTLHIFGNDYNTPDGTACATISMSLTWSRGILQPCATARPPTRSCLPSTWARARAIRCWNWCGHSRKPAGARWPTPWRIAAPATSPRAGPTRL